ncbi:S8 family peptidase [Engelhardtia mirabilis]|uniref:Subtilisin n=1 Tax=Engelhardtia mirabilis TaxID=2528011 RepID=A0A518BML6_9BACT|nr:Subtilisin [Planctomycetes bacterium Pla133]QDV02547.1 Subtilisin [Planctomycetes bacterium Pla86]
MLDSILLGLSVLTLVPAPAPGVVIRPRVRTDQVLVRLAPGSSDHADLARWAGLEPRGVRALPGAGWGLVEVEPTTDEGLREAVAILTTSPEVLFAGPTLGDPRLDPAAGWGAPQPRLLLCGRDAQMQQALAAAADLAPELNLESAQLGGIPGALVMSSPERDGYALLETVELLASDGRLAWVEPDWWITGQGGLSTPNDPLFPQQWAHQNTGQNGGQVGVDLDTVEAWDLSTGSASVAVLVIDTGVDLMHPDLNVAGGEDFTDDGGTGGLPFNACDNHGTWVAGCVSAIADNATGVVGSAPASPVLAARAMISEFTPPVCSGSWSSNASWTVDALDWGVTNGARVTVNSNSYGFTSAAIDARYQLAKTQGVIHFAASGNFSAASVSYPSSLDSVVSVGAIDSTGSKASFSNTGPGLGLVGPGVGIDTTDRSGFNGGSLGDYVTLNGTSFATPLVAGVAALVMAADPTLQPDRVELMLAATATDLGTLGFDEQFGNGLPSARAAVELALGQRDAILGSPGQISLAAGGSQTFELLAGSGGAGAIYLLLGSASGTSPGLSLDGFVLPLVPDNWTNLTISQANVGIFSNTFSAFDTQGRAIASLTIPGGQNPFLAGLVFNHTFIRIVVGPIPYLAIQPPDPAPLQMVP